MAQEKVPNEENIQVILDKLKAYVRILYRTGNTDEKIKRKLAKGNWKLEIINEVMEEVKYEMTLSDETKKQVVHLEHDIERAIHKDIEKIFDREVDKEITTKIEAQIEGEIFDDLEVAIVTAIQKIKPECNFFFQNHDFFYLFLLSLSRQQPLKPAKPAKPPRRRWRLH